MRFFRLVVVQDIKKDYYSGKKNSGGWHESKRYGYHR
jgi:hypothetical protein